MSHAKDAYEANHVITSLPDLMLVKFLLEKFVPSRTPPPLPRFHGPPEIGIRFSIAIATTCVNLLFLKPLIEKDPDEAETATKAPKSSRRSSTPGCWTAAKVALNSSFPKQVQQWGVKVTPAATARTTSIKKLIYLLPMNLTILKSLTLFTTAKTITKR